MYCLLTKINYPLFFKSIVDFPLKPILNENEIFYQIFNVAIHMEIYKPGVMYNYYRICKIVYVSLFPYTYVIRTWLKEMPAFYIKIVFHQP